MLDMECVPLPDITSLDGLNITWLGSIGRFTAHLQGSLDGPVLCIRHRPMAETKSRKVKTNLPHQSQKLKNVKRRGDGLWGLRRDMTVPREVA